MQNLMRTKVGKLAGRYILLISAVGVQAFASQAFAGKDSGGGNAIGGDIKDVKEAVPFVKNLLGSASGYGLTEDFAFNPDAVQDPRLKKVFRDWLKNDGNVTELQRDLASEYVVRKGACPSRTGDHDASTTKVRLAPICFSSTRLSRYPKSTVLLQEVFALAAHEHAHHFGYGENEARAVQKYVFDSFGLMFLQLELRGLYVDMSNAQVKAKQLGVDTESRPLCEYMKKLASWASLYELGKFVNVLDNVNCSLENFDEMTKTMRGLERDYVRQFSQLAK